jgi:type IV secretory pathway protease TraF
MVWAVPLPHWTGCISLLAGQVFVLSPEPDSFDGRYFGPIDSGHVVGAARSVWVKQPDVPHPELPRQRDLS